MSVRFTSLVKNSDGSWSFGWAGTDSWKVVLYGVEMARTSGNTYRFAGFVGFDDFPPPVEVVPDDTLALSEKHRPYVTVQWYREPDAARYLVQQSPDGVADWATVATVQESGQWVYSYRSPVLEDVTTYHWQVIAESPIGTQAAARKYSAHVVTPPRPVDAGITVQYSGGNVIVAEA